MRGRTKSYELGAYDYDPALRLISERFYNAGNVLQETITYQYDAAGNRTSRKVNAAVENYVAESSSAYRLDKVTNASGGTIRDYTTDNAGRVTGIDTNALTHNAVGQMTGFGKTSYTYDGHGQRGGS